MNFRMKFGRILTRLKATSGKLASTIILSFILALVIPGDAWKVSVEYSPRHNTRKKHRNFPAPRNNTPLVIGLPYLSSSTIPETYRPFAYATLNKSKTVNPFMIGNTFPKDVAVEVYVREDCTRLSAQGENALEVKCDTGDYRLDLLDNNRSPKVHAKVVAQSKPSHAAGSRMPPLFNEGTASARDSRMRLRKRMADPSESGVFGQTAAPAKTSGTPSFSNVDVPKPPGQKQEEQRTVSRRSTNGSSVSAAKTQKAPAKTAKPQANGSTASSLDRSEDDVFLDKALADFPDVSADVAERVRKSYAGLEPNAQARLRGQYNGSPAKVKEFVGTVIAIAADETSKEHELTEQRAREIVSNALTGATAEYAQQSKRSGQQGRVLTSAPGGGGRLQPVRVL